MPLPSSSLSGPERSSRTPGDPGLTFQSVSSDGIGMVLVMALEITYHTPPGFDAERVRTAALHRSAICK